ncbi:cytochrome P450 [Abortiporus biennis]|nr:cytochrome P450 [Abortiporus biennis]
MSLIQLSTSFQSLLLNVVLGLIVVPLVYYLFDIRGTRTIPGPILAKFTSAWLGWFAYRGDMSDRVHDQHLKHGPIVRISPNHVSISHPDAIQAIYGHGINALKSNFYDALVQFGRTPSVFTTRSKEDHARKRKIVTHTFAPSQVLAFEPIVLKHQKAFLRQWDKLCEASKAKTLGHMGDCKWTSKDGRVWFDCVPWFSYEAFDILSDLTFGGSFNMIERVQDTLYIIKDPASIRKALQTRTFLSPDNGKFEMEEVSAIETIVNRSEWALAVAVLPNWWRPLVSNWVPWYKTKIRGMERFGRMATTALANRINSLENVDRDDLLSRLFAQTDVEREAGDVEEDQKAPTLNITELFAEAGTLLAAGTDTTSNTGSAIVYYLSKYPHVQHKLQEILDSVLGSPDATSSLEDPDPENDNDDMMESFHSKIKNIVYIYAIINETLRVYSTISLGLPRVVPEEGITILGRTLEPGTVVSVPTYTIHRDKSVWGEDADEFIPERWIETEEDGTEKLIAHKAFIPFSFGPRACLGRNLATMNLSMFVALLFHRYDITLADFEGPMHVRDGFVRKVKDCNIGIKRRGC